MSKERINVTKEDNSVSYSKRWEEDGLTHRLEVEEVEGGYITTTNIYGHRKSAGENSPYIDETTKKVTTENPLAEKKESEASNSPLINSIKSQFGDIQIM